MNKAQTADITNPINNAVVSYLNNYTEKFLCLNMRPPVAPAGLKTTPCGCCCVEECIHAILHRQTKANHLQ